MSRETEDYLTPDQMEAVKAASSADDRLMEEVVKRRYERAVDYLDDGRWTIDSKYSWRRSLDGQKLTFLIDKDRYNLTYPFKTQDKGYWGTGAFNFLFVIANETIDGFGENDLHKLQRTRKPRKGSEIYAPKETLTINKLNPQFLTTKEQRWNAKELPPLELLTQMVKWDDYLQLLVKINPDRETTEYVFDQNFVELNGEMYAIWRVRSMLEFGNQEGYATREQWKELLAKHPVSTTPLLPPPLPVPVFRGIKRKRAYIDDKSAKANERAKAYYLKKKAAQAGMTKEEKAADNKLRSEVYEARALALLRDKKLAEEAERDTHRQGKKRYE